MLFPTERRRGTGKLSKMLFAFGFWGQKWQLDIFHRSWIRFTHSIDTYLHNTQRLYAIYQFGFCYFAAVLNSFFLSHSFYCGFYAVCLAFIHTSYEFQRHIRLKEFHFDTNICLHPCKWRDCVYISNAIGMAAAHRSKYLESNKISDKQCENVKWVFSRRTLHAHNASKMNFIEK